MTTNAVSEEKASRNNSIYKLTTTTRDQAMSDNKKAPVDTETILLTLDQIGQTIDIMTTVVGRLRGYISEQHTPPIANKCSQKKDIEQSLTPMSTTLH